MTEKMTVNTEDTEVPEELHSLAPRTTAQPRFTSSPYEPVAPPVEDVRDVDLTDPDLMRRGDPHDVWMRLRQEAPIHWHEKGLHGTRGRGFWAVTRYADCAHVHRRADLFSSSETTFPDALPEEFPRQLSSMDALEHGMYRKLISPFFTPAAINKWHADVLQIVTDLLDEAQERGEFDFLATVGNPLPIHATGRFLGVPPEEIASLAESLQSVDLAHPEAMAAYTDAVRGFFDEVTRNGTALPEDGIIGAVMNGKIDGVPIDRADALTYLWILFTGALDTTTHAAAGGLLSLFHHPAEFQRLREDPSLTETGVDEMLRWVAPSNVEKRLVMADTSVGGVEFTAGDYVLTWIASANRDEAAFPDPFRFDVGRKDKPLNLTFGLGPHVCIGRNFARLELQVLFQEMIRRFGTIEQAGPAIRGKAFTIIMSPLRTLPIRVS